MTGPRKNRKKLGENAKTRNSPKLIRATLKTSRQLDFFSEKELTAQTGHPKRDWPLVLLKELLDNALDAAEDGGIATKIAVMLDANGITYCDTGTGLPAKTVADVLHI